MKKNKIKKKFEMKMSRRQVLKAGLYGGAAMMLPWRFLPAKAFAAPAAAGLSDPALQPKFVNLVPDALAPGFKILTPKSNDTKLKVFVGASTQYTGLEDSSGNQLPTNIWGYGKNNWNLGVPTWPGPTLEAKSKRRVEVRWENNLCLSHLLPVDTSLH
jgi:spore coat protein A